MEENELPDGWVWTKLENVTFPTRMSVQPTDYPALPFIGMEHVEAETMRLLGTIPASELKSNSLHFYSGNVLYGRLRPYLNKVLRADFEGLCSAEFLVFRETSNLQAKYLQYFLNSWSFKEFASHLNEGDRPRVDWSQLKNFDFPLAPLSEQQRIVAAIEQQFTRLDAGVAALKSTQTRLKRYRAAVLKAAVEGKLTEAWRAEHPTSEPASQLLARILQERRAKWEDDLRAKGKDPAKVKYVEPATPDMSELGELPEGWCWATVEQIAAAEPNAITDGPFGSNLKTEHYKTEGGRVIRLQNIGEGEFKDEKAFISWEHFETLRKHRVFAGDILIAALGENPPRSCIMPDFVGPAIVKADCIRYKVSSQVVSTFINYVLNAEPTHKRTLAKLHGIGRPRLNLSEIKSIVILLPPLDEQLEIVSEVERRLSVVSKLEAMVEANLKRAERLRQSILKEAFAGRLVEQDPDDEPANVLLERIRKEREARGKQGKQGKQDETKKDVVAASLWT